MASDDVDKLKVYYSYIFPLELYYNWLSYGEVGNFRRREFSFTFDNDIMTRYQCFTDENHFGRELRRQVPVKIDVGAIFNSIPSKKGNMDGKLEAIQRELVFDIDLTDYDDVRTCCSGADICLKCWKYIILAVKILDIGLREDFGYQNVLWVFSGRRGVHAWVCDDEARTLEKSQRSAVGDYFQILSGGQFNTRKIVLHNIHHSVQRALDIIEPMFIPLCIEDQKMLETDKAIDAFVSFLPEDSRPDVKSIFQKYGTSLERWAAFKIYAAEQIQSNKKWRLHRNIVPEIMLQYCYPRLDINVTKGLNHLLKSPFCVHPKTGKISIPFNPKAVDKLNPLQVPTLHGVLQDLDLYNEKSKAFDDGACSKDNIHGYKKTSLIKSVHVFQEFLRDIPKVQHKEMKAI